MGLLLLIACQSNVWCLNETTVFRHAETEVCELIARGRSVAAIAEELFVSENTVRTHSKHIYTKLDIHSRQELGELLSTVDPTL